MIIEILCSGKDSNVIDLILMIKKNFPNIDVDYLNIPEEIINLINKKNNLWILENIKFAELILKECCGS
ncbi:MAG TPA: hypothetical protein VIK14_16950 [Ignavibacteria bacterium]